MKLGENFNKINLTKEYKFIKENYLVYVKNYGNKIKIEFKRYNSMNKIEELENNIEKLEESNKKISKENKKLKNTLNNYKSRKIVRIVDKIRSI